MIILGIETSCDETAAAVIEGLGTRGQGLELKVLSNVVASQIKIHAKTGGVVPEVAARAHVEKIIPVVEEALEGAGVRGQGLGTSKSKHTRPYPLEPSPSIDAIAVTAGPGLVTSLLVGVEVARTLSWIWKKPVVAVNHLAGHVYANWLPPMATEERKNKRTQEQVYKSISSSVHKFPILCLIVSGGHTELVLMRRHLDFQVIGATRDDAAGEAFDKVAKMLGLGYPGGPAISALAEKFQITNHKLQTNPKSKIAKPQTTSSIRFPRPMMDQKGDFSAKGGPASGWDFSFSGLKTAVLYYLRSQQNNVRPDIKMLRGILPEICYEFQEAVVDVLVSKTVRAAKEYHVKTVLLGGGVAANARLRQRLVEAIRRQLPTTSYVLPSFRYTTDNAAMIAAAGYFMARAKQFTPWQKLDVDPNWEIGTKFKPILR